MQSFKSQAEMLINNGFDIVPIESGQKFPTITGWNIKSFTLDDITAGVGVKTGNGVMALDIDVLDEGVSNEIAALAEKIVGYSITRVGRAPKQLIVYGGEGRKRMSAKFKDDNGNPAQVEVLGKGQQFVAYGVHPNTGKEYEWTDLYGGDMHMIDLPVITDAHVDELFSAFEQMAADRGWENISKAKSAPAITGDDFSITEKTGLSIAEVKKMLSHIPVESYDNYLNVAMALHHEFADTINESEAVDLLDEWSSSYENYQNRGFTQKTWASLNGRGVAHPVTLRSVIQASSSGIKAEQRDAKKAFIAEFVDVINAAGDIVELEEVARDIGKKLDAKSLAMVDTVRNALIKKWRGLAGSADKTTINKLLGLGETYGMSADATQFGNVTKFINENGDTLRYIAETNEFIKYDGNKWQMALSIDCDVIDTLKDIAGELLALNNTSKEVISWANQCQSKKMAKDVFDLIQMDRRVRLPFASLNSNKRLFGVGNGVIDLTTGKHWASEPDDYITVATDVDYDPDATCPLWNRVLLECMGGDEEMVAFLKRAYGYALMANPKESKIFVLHGGGANGKSTISTTIQAVLGDHASMSGAEVFASDGKDSKGAPREDLLRLAGKRYVYSSELEESAVLKESLIKAMTGGEKLTARGLYQKHTVEIQPSWVVFMPTNHKPIIKGNDNGIWRRIVLIPFEVNFEDIGKVDRGIFDRLRAEHSGILKWLIEGALEYQKVGLSIPKRIQDATNEYRRDMDLLAEWIDSECEVGTDYEESNVNLWNSWYAFSSVRGDNRYIPSAVMLGRKLSADKRFKSYRTKHGRGFKGIRIKAVEGEF